MLKMMLVYIFLALFQGLDCYPQGHKLTTSVDPVSKRAETDQVALTKRLNDLVSGTLLNKVQWTKEQHDTAYQYIVDKRKNVEPVSVSFTATDPRNPTPPAGARVVMTHVVTNNGGCYNQTSGRFTAPRNATYSFAADLTGWGPKGSGLAVVLMIGEGRSEEGVVSTMVEFSEREELVSTSLHALVAMTAGQHAWLETTVDGINFFPTFHVNSFSGFLLYE